MLSKEHQMLLQDTLQHFFQTADTSSFGQFCLELLAYSYPDFEALPLKDEQGDLPILGWSPSISTCFLLPDLAPESSSAAQALSPSDDGVAASTPEFSAAPTADTTKDASVSSLSAAYSRLMKELIRLAEAFPSATVRESQPLTAAFLIPASHSKLCKEKVPDAEHLRTLLAGQELPLSIRPTILTTPGIFKLYWSRTLSDRQRLYLAGDPIPEDAFESKASSPSGEGPSAPDSHDQNSGKQGDPSQDNYLSEGDYFPEGEHFSKSEHFSEHFSEDGHFSEDDHFSEVEHISEENSLLTDDPLSNHNPGAEGDSFPKHSSNKKSSSSSLQEDGSRILLLTRLPQLPAFYLERSGLTALLCDQLSSRKPFYLYGPSGIGVRTGALAFAWARQNSDSPGRTFWLEHAADFQTFMGLLSESRLDPDSLVILNARSWYQTLIRDELYSAFLTLPVQILILASEEVPESEHRLLLDPLPEKDQLLLYQHYAGMELSKPAHLSVAGGNTLTILLLATLSRTFGKSKAEEMKKILRSRYSVSPDSCPSWKRICALLQIGSFQPSEQRVLLHGSLLPPEGLPVSLFSSFETLSERKALASLLEEYWLIRSEADLLNMHPLLQKAVQEVWIYEKKRTKQGFPKFSRFFRPAVYEASVHPEYLLCRDFLEKVRREMERKNSNQTTDSAELLLSLSRLFASAAEFFEEEERAAYFYFAASLAAQAGRYDQAAVLQALGISGKGSSDSKPCDDSALLSLADYLLKAGDPSACLSAIRQIQTMDLLDEDAKKHLLELTADSACLLADYETLRAVSETAVLTASGAELFFWELQLANGLVLTGQKEEADQRYTALLSKLDSLTFEGESFAPDRLWYENLKPFGSLGHTPCRHDAILAVIANASERYDTDSIPYLTLTLFAGFSELEHDSYKESRDRLEAAADLLSRKEAGLYEQLNCTLLATLGWLYGRTGRKQLALLVYERLLDLLPASGTADPSDALLLRLYSLAQLAFLRRESHAGADQKAALRDLSRFEQLLSELPADLPYSVDSASVTYAHGMLCFETGDYDAAISYLRRLPRDYHAYLSYCLASAYARTRQNGQALLVLEEGLELAEQWEEASRNKDRNLLLGWLNLERGKILTSLSGHSEQAIASCKAAVSCFLAHPDTDPVTLASGHWQLGQAYASAHLKEEALREYDSVLHLLEHDTDHKSQFNLWIREVRDARIRLYQNL